MYLRSLRLGVLACASLVPVTAFAADGDLDATFGVDGIAIDTELYPVTPAVAVQSDDKIVICDSTPVLGAGREVYVARFERDGAPDNTFGNGGSMTFTFEEGDEPVDSYCSAVAIQQDGKIVLAGYGDIQNFPLDGPASFAVARIDAGGELDPSFGAGTGWVIFSFDGF